VNTEFTILTGTGSPAFTRIIASELGVQLSAREVKQHPDCDVAVELLGVRELRDRLPDGVVVVSPDVGI
jgi:hypothetical protein